MLKWPFQAINRHNRDRSSILRHIPIALEPSKAQRLRYDYEEHASFLRSFVTPSTAGQHRPGGPQQTSCEESVARLLSFTMGSGYRRRHFQVHYFTGMGVICASQGVTHRAHGHAGP